MVGGSGAITACAGVRYAVTVSRCPRSGRCDRQVHDLAHEVIGIQHAASADVAAHPSHHAYERTPGAATRPLPRGYHPRRPETTAVYRVIATHLETMLQDARDRSAHGYGLPRHVEVAFRKFLDCGVIERGFARVACPSCRYEILVPFSCKTRGLCPSCAGRRMADGAAFLVDHLLPREADYRQWTLSLPHGLRARVLRDKSLASAVLAVFVRSVFADLRRRARTLDVPHGIPGAVTSIQFGGSFATANLHFHTIVPEGVWQERADGSVTFHPLPPPTDDEVLAITMRIVRGVARLLDRRDEPDAGDDDEPDALDLARAEALKLPLPSSPTSRTPITTSTRRRAAIVDGFSLHADTSVDAADRAGLERLIRYILRPIITADRVTVRPDGRVEYKFRKPDPSGRTSWVTDGPTWCRRLATLLPPRRGHTTRFHGVFASAHRLRARVVPTPVVEDPSATTPTANTLARRLDWAALLRRVWGPDVTTCPQCGDRLRVIALLSHPEVTAPILAHLGIASAIPPLAPARAPPDQLDLSWP